MYSEYANKPLDHFERFERYYGIPKSKFAQTKAKKVADAVRNGVRRIFVLGALPLFDADITLANEATPPLELAGDITIEDLDAAVETLLEDVKGTEKAESVVETTKSDKASNSSEEHKEKTIPEGLEKRSKAAEAAAEAAIMRESATEAPPTYETSGIDPKGHETPKIDPEGH